MKAGMILNHRKKLGDYINVYACILGILYLSIFLALCFAGKNYGTEKHGSFWLAINYLALVLNIKCYWFPGRVPDQYNELGLKSEKDNQIGVLVNPLNPLYRNGSIIHNKKCGFIKTSKIKGIYFLQIQALMQSVLLFSLILCEFLFVLRNMNIPSAIIIANKGILIYIFIGYALLIGTVTYYHHLIDRERKRIFLPLLKKGFLESGTETTKYDILTFKHFSESDAVKNFYRLYNYVDHLKMTMEQKSEKLSICIGEDIYCYTTRILVQFCTHKLQQKHIAKIEEVVHKFIEQGIKNKRFPSAPIVFTCIIYADVTSKTFAELICKGSSRQKDVIILPVGIVKRSHNIYIAGALNEYDVDMYKHKNLKDDILKLLGIKPFENDTVKQREENLMEEHI